MPSIPALSLWQAVHYVLRVRTNVILVVVSATGHFFLGGVQAFGVIFTHRNYDLGQSSATSALALLGLGAALGTLVGGRLAFSIMLLPLGAAGLILLRARRTYATDVATALAGREDG